MKGSPKRHNSGYSLVDASGDKERGAVDNEPFVRPSVTNRKPQPRLPTVHIETYTPSSSSNAPVTRDYNIRNIEYTISAPDSQPSGIRPYYNVENFNKTDVRNNYNLDQIYRPPVSTPSPKVDGFNVPLRPNLATRYVEEESQTVAPQTQLSPSLSAGVSYADSGERDIISGRMDTNPNYYTYEAVGPSSDNRNANNYELPTIVKPLKQDNRNAYISGRSNGNNNRNALFSNNNNDYATTAPRLNPTQFFQQIYGKGLQK